MGLYSEEDTPVMLLAVCILIRSLDLGKADKTIQLSTAKNLCSLYSNDFHASMQHQTGLSVMAQNIEQIWVTACSPYGYCFAWFMGEVHKQMGKEVRLEDVALLVSMLQRMLGRLDKQWADTRSFNTRQLVVEIAMFLVAAFKEVILLATLPILKWAQDHNAHPHVMISLLGRLKGDTGERWHLLPIVGKTRSGIKVARCGQLGWLSLFWRETGNMVSYL
jgi:hypothetical protein